MKPTNEALARGMALRIASGKPPGHLTDDEVADVEDDMRTALDGWTRPAPSYESCIVVLK